MNTTDKAPCGNGCKVHCALCDAHMMLKRVPSDWVRVERGRYICNGCDYMNRMAEKDPVYVARMVAMRDGAAARFIAGQEAHKAWCDAFVAQAIAKAAK